MARFTTPADIPSTVEKYVITGTFIDAPTPKALRVRENCEIVVDARSGRIEAIRDAVEVAGKRKSDEGEKARAENIVMVDMGATQVVCPGLIDCHVHAPQFRQLGTKTDVPLVEWLDKYTFPEEATFSSLTHAERIYTALVRRLLRNGTTTALYFGSNHLPATQVLADTCAGSGQRAFVGKTCSDQFLPEYYVETTDSSLKDTESFITYCREKWPSEAGLVKPVVTPRFVPTCSAELLDGLGKLAAKYNCHVQTHASESVDEVAWVAELYPTEKRDINILQRFGLLTDKTVLAHCCHLYDEEVGEVVRAGAAITSCPYSNILFARATVPIPHFKSLGLKIGMGSDIAGGMSSSLWTNMRLATLQDRIDSFSPRGGDKPAGKENWVVDYKYAFHVATVGGAEALGIGKEVGLFEVGMRWDALLVDYGLEDMAFENLHDDGVSVVDVRDGFERFVNCGDDRNIVGVWVDGKLVCERK
ncbi:hypothetical protein DFP73DRAFT_535725 [Morchella snyderi]|nr:hypothetical protein DFP73DRAFT_535725 [Morchella snyderi]